MMAVLKHSPVCLGLLACGGLAATGVAQAQPTGAYPVKSIRIIVPFPPGGGTDKLARMLASRFTTTLGQPVEIGRAHV